MEVRLARTDDSEAIRAIYNAEITGSTVTFDFEPRTAAAQREWVEHHQGAHPAVVAVEGACVAGFGSLSLFRDRPAYATTVEDSVYVDSSGVARGWAGSCSTSSCAWRPPRVSHRDRPVLGRQRPVHRPARGMRIHPRRGGA